MKLEHLANHNDNYCGINHSLFPEDNTNFLVFEELISLMPNILDKI